MRNSSLGFTLLYEKKNRLNGFYRWQPYVEQIYSGYNIFTCIINTFVQV